jgi:phasin family protein
MATTKPTTVKPLPSFPGFDGDKLTSLQQRNLDAFASASQIVVDSVKAMAQRQSEIVQASVDQMVAAGQGTWAGKPMDFQPTDQIESAKSQYQTAVANAKELTEIALKAQTEAADVLTKCVMANIDDLKSLAKAA